MKRRINSTGRRRSERRHVKISLLQTPGHERPRIEASFDLEDLKLDPSAEIVLEARFKDFAQRFAWGTVGHPAPQNRPQLSEVPPEERIFFSVKAVEPSSHRLFALARKIYPIGSDDEDGSRRALFRVRRVPLGQELWRVVIREDGAPLLELNAEVPNVLARFREPEFRAAILPAAMRTVLLELDDDDVDQEEDPESWQQRWFRFAEQMADEERPDAQEPAVMHAWIDSACSRFAERFGLVSAMVASAEPRREP